MNILANLNLNRNEIQNAVIQPLGTAPSNAKTGQIYFNSNDKCLYQYTGTAWKKVGVVYTQGSSTGVVITGLDDSGTVTTTDVIDLTLDDYVPVEGGYVSEGDSLQTAFASLDEAVKNAIAGGGEVNQNAWSYIKVGSNTISATAKTDTFNVTGSGGASVSADASTKTVTVNVPVDSALNSSSANPVQNKVVNTAINAKYTKPSSGIPKTDLATAVQTKIDNAVQKDGTVAMTGALSMGSHKITGLTDGTENTDAATVGQLNGVSSGLSTEISERKAADLALETSIDNEVTARTSADTALGTRITTEETTRANADTTLGTRIDNEASARETADTALQTAINTINGKISSQASSTNKLVSASEMGDAIASVEANQLYATASQGSFATKAALTSATKFYNADGTEATPTKNDVVYVLADETHEGKSAKYVVASLSSGKPVWGFVITFSDTTFSQAQMDAINSGITGTKRTNYDNHLTNTSNPHSVTKAQVGLGNVDNKSESTIKSDFTGSIASGNTGFVTGGAAYTALDAKADKTVVNAIPVVKVASGNIATSAKTVSVSYSGSNVINTFVKDASGNEVLVDVAISSTSVTFSTAQNPTSALTCYVIYI